MNFVPDLTIYADDRQYKVAGFTPCGARNTTCGNPTRMPARGMGSADGRRVLALGEYGVSESWFHCFDIASGKKLWSYPDNFVGVHGSHQACPPAVGMIRGSFGPCGAARLAAPIGGVWVIPTNVGEWHIVTDDGFYLTRLFQGDPMKVVWPEKAVPGAVLDNCPPGMGGEDFGGSCCLAQDGKFFVQAGKTGFWNIEVVGLETVKAARRRPVGDHARRRCRGRKIRVEQLQASVGTQARWPSRRRRVAFSGNFDQDFSGADVIQFQKQDEAAGPRRGRLGRPEPVPRLGRSRQDALDQQGRRCRNRCTSAATPSISSSAPIRRRTRIATRPSEAICGFRSATSRANRPP